MTDAKTFQELINRQRLLQIQLGVNTNNISYLREMILAANVELVELLNESNWKPWKKPSKVVNAENALMECADVFLFLMNIMLHHDFCAEQLFNAIEIKQAIVLQRNNLEFGNTISKTQESQT